MQNRVVLRGAVAALSLLVLSACGRSTSNAPSAGAPPPPAPAAPGLTDAQQKALLAELPASYRGADLSNGEAKFAVCRSCHTLNEGGDDMVGPNLWGVFGRKAGSKPGFSFSDDMKAAGWTWDAGQLDRWIANPKAVLLGTKMTYVGLPDANDRRDVIAFLKVHTSPPPKG
jgi:cytochrome c